MHGCERCGRLDSTLRGAGFGYAVSLIFVTFRRSGSAGVFCARCRKKEAFKYSLVSGLFGWWGIPWGPLYTVQTIGKNSAGGYQDEEFNADLLAAVGAHLAERGEDAEAVRALETSLRFVDQPEVRQFLWAVQGASATGAVPASQSAVGSPVSGNAPQAAQPTTGVSLGFSPGDLVFWRTNTPLRRSPSGESEVLVSLDPGEAIVTRISGEWTHIRALNGQSGWVSGQTLSKGNSGP